MGGKGWQNKGYIFPDGFRSRTVFRSSIDPEQVGISRTLTCPQCWLPDTNDMPRS